MTRLFIVLVVLGATFISTASAFEVRCNLARRHCGDGGGKYNTYVANAKSINHATERCKTTAQRNGNHKFCGIKEFTYTPGKGWWTCNLDRNGCYVSKGKYKGLVKASGKYQAEDKCQTLANRNGHYLCYR
jgi:hypothetical protein